FTRFPDLLCPTGRQITRRGPSFSMRPAGLSQSVAPSANARASLVIRGPSNARSNSIRIRPRKQHGGAGILSRDDPVEPKELDRRTRTLAPPPRGRPAAPPSRAAPRAASPSPPPPPPPTHTTPPPTEGGGGRPPRGRGRAPPPPGPPPGGGPPPRPPATPY